MRRRRMAMTMVLITKRLEVTMEIPEVVDLDMVARIRRLVLLRVGQSQQLLFPSLQRSWPSLSFLSLVVLHMVPLNGPYLDL
ncbi:hypothetical protein ANCCAN_29525 [Ancylostoma caninum]|uniref:Uncharacterized protein n=1 Tax=Ancylostoma caninum TaxID=29170 RepID=A0A368EY89_ANCCA|nr:hypothetical protein ANCCAN_29525 [Ancylostoma caninum]